MSVWFVRHQAAGIVHEYPFAQRPTEEQLAPLRGLLDWRHGTHHAKSGAPHWLDVIEVPTLGANDMPPGAPAGAVIGAGATGGTRGAAHIDLSSLVATGVGHVRNPRGR